MDSTPEEPNSDANLNKPVSNHIKYRGVRYRNSGKFVAEIRDPKKRARVWLGTFGSGIEAAKAYDKAAFEIYGHKARLNFPLDFGISPVKTEAITVDRKRTKDDDIVTVAVVNGDHRLPIDAVKLLDGSGPSSPPSAHGSGRPICQSAPSANFKWTDESLCAMCDILNKHIAKNGRNCPFDWADHQVELEKISNHKFRTPSAIRNKYDAMRGRYYLWKSLKNGETGLRWNERTGKLDCSDDWWEKNIKENAEFKLVRRNQPSRELQEAWDLLFENVVASGVDCVDLNKSNQVDHVGLDSVDVSPERTLDSSQFGNLGTEEAEVPSFSKSKNEVRQEDGLVPIQGDGCKPSQNIVKRSATPTLVKCKTSESERATMFKEFMTQPNATRQSASKIRKTSNINQVGEFSIGASVGVINRMVEEGLMTSCSELWCFAVNLFEDDVKRELFMSLPNDVGRLAWLQYKHNLGN